MVLGGVPHLRAPIRRLRLPWRVTPSKPSGAAGYVTTVLPRAWAITGERVQVTSGTDALCVCVCVSNNLLYFYTIVPVHQYSTVKSYTGIKYFLRLTSVLILRSRLRFHFYSYSAHHLQQATFRVPGARVAHTPNRGKSRS